MALALPTAWEPWFQSFSLALEADGAKPRTVRAYRDALTMFGVYLAQQGPVPDLLVVDRRQVQEFLAELHRTRRPTTAHQRFRSLHRIFGWLESEQEVERSPMAGMKAPKLELEPPAVLSPDEVRALLKATEGMGFEERRDRALILFLYDTGTRRGEVEGMRVPDVDLRGGEALVSGKSGPRIVAFGKRTAAALDRYLRIRAGHPRHHEAWLWLGKQGRLRGDGAFQMLRRRASQARLERKVFLHLFRHSAAHSWLADGGAEGDLMKLMGWSSRQMTDRYGASAASERARAAHRIHSPADRL